MLPPFRFFADPGFIDADQAASKAYEQAGIPPEERPTIVPGARKNFTVPVKIVGEGHGKEGKEVVGSEALNATDEDIPEGNRLPEDTSGTDALVDQIKKGHAANEQLGSISPVPMQQGNGPGPKIWGGHYFEPGGGEDIAKNIPQGAYQRLGQAQQEEAAVAKRQADEEQKLYDAQAQELNAKYVADEAARQEHKEFAYSRLQQLDQQAQQLAKQKIDSGRLMRNPVGFLGALVVSLSAIGSKNPDASVQIINQAIQRDIDVQQANIDISHKNFANQKGIYNDYLNLFKNEEQARLMSEAQMKRAAAMKLQEISARYRSPLIDAQAKQQAQMLTLMANKDEQNAYLKFWREFQAINPALAKAYQQYQAPPSFKAGQDKMLGQADAMMARDQAQLSAGPSVGGESGTGPETEVPDLQNPNARQNIPTVEIQGSRGGQPGKLQSTSVPEVKKPPMTMEGLAAKDKAFAQTYPEAKRVLDAAINMTTEGDYEAPGIGKVITSIRKDIAYDAALEYLNAHQDEYRANPRQAAVKATNAGQIAYKSAAKKAEENTEKIAAAHKEYAEHDYLVTSLDASAREILASFNGDRNKVNSFLSAVNGYGVAKFGELQQRSHEISTIIGSEDAQTRKALNFLRNYQELELQERRSAVKGMRGDKEAQEEAKQEFTPFNSFQSIENRIKQARNKSNALRGTIIDAAGSEPAALIWLAKHRDTVGGLKRPKQ